MPIDQHVQLEFQCANKKPWEYIYTIHICGKFIDKAYSMASMTNILFLKVWNFAPKYENIFRTHICSTCCINSTTYSIPLKANIQRTQCRVFIERIGESTFSWFQVEFTHFQITRFFQLKTAFFRNFNIPWSHMATFRKAASCNKVTKFSSASVSYEKMERVHWQLPAT